MHLESRNWMESRFLTLGKHIKADSIILKLLSLLTVVLLLLSIPSKHDFSQLSSTVKTRTHIHQNRQWKLLRSWLDSKLEPFLPSKTHLLSKGDTIRFHLGLLTSTVHPDPEFTLHRVGTRVKVGDRWGKGGQLQLDLDRGDPRWNSTVQRRIEKDAGL